MRWSHGQPSAAQEPPGGNRWGRGSWPNLPPNPPSKGFTLSVTRACPMSRPQRCHRVSLPNQRQMSASRSVPVSRLWPLLKLLEFEKLMGARLPVEHREGAEQGDSSDGQGARVGAEELPDTGRAGHAILRARHPLGEPGGRHLPALWRALSGWAAMSRRCQAIAQSESGAAISASGLSLLPGDREDGGGRSRAPGPGSSGPCAAPRTA